MKADSQFALENALWPALLVDASGNIRRSNPSAISLFGPVLEGTAPQLSSIWSPENEWSAEQFLHKLERSMVAGAPLKYRIRGGVTAVLGTYVAGMTQAGQKYFVFQLYRDAPTAPGDGVTALFSKPQPAEVVAQTQKLDCALQLARSVALDFNNALTSILGHVSLVLSRMEPAHPWRSSLVEVEKSAQRAAEIANDLASFSRQDRDSNAHVAGNLNALLRRCVELFQTPATENITWHLRLENRAFTVAFEEAKMQQAFVKILENAVDAVQALEGRNGSIVVQSRNLELTSPTQDRNVHLAAGNYVCVEITDDGKGIPEEILPRIFEPFFTTKHGHRGLGLAWVYGIVTNHGGSVAISSDPGRCTSVHVYLPASRKIVKDRSKIKGGDLTGNQTVLIVDDEDLLLTMGQMVLSSYGYRVLIANTGHKALELMSKADAHIDLVITDLVMPQMSGRELIEHIRRLSPETHILRTSGYVRPASDEEDADYLHKPFTTQELLLKVKQVLAPAESA